MLKGWLFNWFSKQDRVQEQSKSITQERSAVPSHEEPSSEPSAEERARHFASLGDRARDTGSWAEAAQQYAFALEQRPVWPDIRVQYGHALKESGRLLEAEDAYRRAAQEADDPADALLQLGHALKLQRRYVEAEETYFASLSHDPNSPHARSELLALGISSTVLDRHITAIGVKRDIASTGATNDGQSPREVFVERPPARMHGRITAVTSTSIRGEILEIPPGVSPIVVCRRGHETLCVTVLERDAEAITIPTDRLDFEIELPPNIDDLVSISLEPEGRPLLGSPVIPLGPATASLLERIAKIENQMGQGSLESTIEKRLERRLIAGATYGVAAHVESLLNRQRALFERQLVAAGAPPRPLRNYSSSIWATDTRHPARVLIDAPEGFGGLGWSTPEVEHGGFCRWMARHAFVKTPISLSRPAVMKATIAVVASPHLLYGLRVSVGGTFVPCWVEMHPSDPSIYIWTALISTENITSDTVDYIALHSDDVIANRGKTIQTSVAIRDIEFGTIPITERASFRLDGGSFWFLKGWKRSEITATPLQPQSTVLLPTLIVKEAADLGLEGRGLINTITQVLLNGKLLRIQAADHNRMSFRIEASDWSTNYPNELSIIWRLTDHDDDASISHLTVNVLPLAETGE
jgi:tetratricopeptide (TPR) repeat protein